MRLFSFKSLYKTKKVCYTVITEFYQIKGIEFYGNERFQT